MQELKDILGILISASGATIFFCITLIVICSFLAFSQNVRQLISQRSVRIAIGDKHLELGALTTPATDPHEPNNAFQTQPTPIEPNPAPTDTTNFTSISSETREKSEQELLWYMTEVTYGDRDLEKLEQSYQEIKSLSGRKIDDETLETTYLRHKLFLGDTNAETKLKALLAEHLDWVQPAFRLAHFYISLSDLPRAAEYIDLAEIRSAAEQNKLSVAELRADLLVDDKSGALKLLWDT